MVENMTLLIDPETRDLVFDEDGSFKKIYAKDTTIQNVRHALSTWKKEFFADLEHGTDYESIMSKNQNEIEDEEVKDIIREAAFQEPDVQRIDAINVSYDRRTITVQLSATLVNDESITLEVTA